MTYLLLFITVVLILIILWQSIVFYRSKKSFNKKIKIFENFISELTIEHQKQSIKFQLSEELLEKLHEVNAIMNKNIFDLNYELIEELYPKKNR